MVTAGSETAGDKAPHCDSRTLPARVGGDGMVQVELGRCGGLASEAALVGGGWRWGNMGGGRRCSCGGTGSGDGKARRRQRCSCGGSVREVAHYREVSGAARRSGDGRARVSEAAVRTRGALSRQRL
jgi:hypothetical protein